MLRMPIAMSLSYLEALKEGPSVFGRLGALALVLVPRDVALHLERSDAVHATRVEDVARLRLAKIDMELGDAVGRLVQVLGRIGTKEGAGDCVKADDHQLAALFRRGFLGLQ